MNCTALSIALVVMVMIVMVMMVMVIVMTVTFFLDVKKLTTATTACDFVLHYLQNKAKIISQPIPIYVSGNYSAYGFEMHLSRSLGPFILSIYLPSAM